MYKLVAIDLDGTLLNSYGEVSERVRDIIKKAIVKGSGWKDSDGTECDLCRYRNNIKKICKANKHPIFTVRKPA